MKVVKMVAKKAALLDGMMVVLKAEMMAAQ